MVIHSAVVFAALQNDRMKARKDSKLKSRALKNAEFGDMVFAWVNEPKTDRCVGGAAYAKEKLAEMQIPVSERTIDEFYSWWGLRKAYHAAVEHANAQRELMLRFDPSDVERAEKFGDFCFIQQAIAAKDPQAYVGLGMLREKRRARELKSEDLQLQRARFEFNAAKAALAHLHELRQIQADRSMREDAKIDAVRFRLFGKAPER